MEAAKKWLKQNRFLPTLSMKKSGEYTMAILAGEETRFTDKTGEEKVGLRLYVVHEKQLKTVLTSSYQLIQYLADVEEGSVVKINKGYVNGKTVYDLTVLKQPDEVKDELQPYFEELDKYKAQRSVLSSDAKKAKEEIEKEIEESVKEEFY